MSACRSIQRKYTTGRPDQKDLNENLAAAEGLAHMITECQHLFQVITHKCAIFGPFVQILFFALDAIRLCS